MNFGLNLTFYRKNNSKWNINLISKCKTAECLEKRKKKILITWGQTILRHNTKSMIYGKKKLMKWISSKLKTFSVQKKLFKEYEKKC